MPVKNIQPSNIPEKSVKNTDNSRTPKNNTILHQATPNSFSVEDKLKISASGFVHDVDMAKNILARLDERQIEGLQQIKKNIADGYYENEAVKDHISKKIGNDIIKLETWLNVSNKSGPDADKINITEERTDFLKNNNDVLNAVVSSLIEDLQKI